MLVLRRKVRETIVIAGNIKVVVLAFEGKRVKIGIEAPAEIVILRDELCQQAELPQQTTHIDEQEATTSRT